MCRRVVTLAGLVALVVSLAPRPAGADQRGHEGVSFVLAIQQPAPAGGDFVPVSELPDARRAEQMPAAPMLIAAYVVVWLAVLLYVWSLWRKLAVVEREVADVARRVDESRRS
jgi:CcmD family protein